MNIREKVYDFKNRLKDRQMLTLVVTLVTVIVLLGLYTYKRERREKKEKRKNGQDKSGVKKEESSQTSR